MKTHVPAGSCQQPALLEVQGLSKRYVRGRWPAARVRVVALDGINLVLPLRGTLALVGKSGSGKSTLARCLSQLEAPDAGEIRFEGRDVTKLRKTELRSMRRDSQLVFQQSATALNPFLSVLDIVAEPIRIGRTVSRKESVALALAMLEQVGMPGGTSHRSPMELSGGQRQRVAIARALILKPKLLILDEALSGLDLCTQAEIANLLVRLRASLSLSYIFITHDLRMAAHLADRIAVIDHGRIVEAQDVASLFAHTERQETRELIRSIPRVLEPAGANPAASL